MGQHKLRKGFPKPGQSLSVTFKGKEYRATVVAIDKKDVRSRVRVQIDGKEFKSLSAAGKHITGYWVNGYEFWGVE